MKAFALAVAVAAGLAFSAGTADAQYRARGSYARSYAVPTYVAPAYNYAVPTYPSGVVVTSGYEPVVTPTVYPNGYYYSPSAWSPTSYNPYYGGGFYNAYAYPRGGVFVSPGYGVYRGRW
jgi:hypothetical protein